MVKINDPWGGANFDPRPSVHKDLRIRIKIRIKSKKTQIFSIVYSYRLNI
jgi:hypothetical protein